MELDHRSKGRTRRWIQAAIVSFLALSLDACKYFPQPPPPPPADPILSFRIRMQFRHFRNDILTKEVWADRQAVDAHVFALMSNGVPQAGANTWYPIRFAGVDGWVVPRYDNAVMPAIWRTVWTSSNEYPGCSNIHQDWELARHDWWHLTFRCNFYEYGFFISANYGVDMDGNAIWTGGADKLFDGAVLYPGDSRTSADGRYQLIYQGDGNLVLYGPSGVTWASNCWPSGAPCRNVGSPGYAQNQAGRLVVQSSNEVWSSNSGPWSGATLVVQADGNAVFYEPYGTALWSTAGGGGGAQSPSGRWKDDGHGGCYWDPNDSGPNQCTP